MEVMEYEIKYPNLDIQHLIKNKQLFDYDLIAAYVKEYEKGFKVKKVGKTHRSGTNFTYMQIADEKEIEEYKKTLMEMINSYNNKYEAQITLKEFIWKNDDDYYLGLSKNNKKYFIKI